MSTWPSDLPEIEWVFGQNLKVYRVRKVWHQIHREGFKVARCTVARLIEDIGIEGVIRGKTSMQHWKYMKTFVETAWPKTLRANHEFIR